MNEWIQAERDAERADQLLQAGQWQQALTLLERAVSINPEQGRWQIDLGRTFDALGRPRDAIRAYRRAIELLGEDIEVYLHLALSLIRAGRSRRALAVLDRAHRMDRNHERIYCLRIAAHTQLLDHDQAEVAYYLARQIKAHCPICDDHLARSLALRGQLDQAIACWQRTLADRPDYPDAAANLARAYWQRGDRAQAVRLFERHLVSSPFDNEAMRELAGVWMELGRLAGARSLFERILERDPLSASARLGLGEIAMLAHKPMVAREELAHAARLDPHLPIVRLRLAQLALACGRGDVATRHLSVELGQKAVRTPEQTLEMCAALLDCGFAAQAMLHLEPMMEGPDRARLRRDILARAHLYRAAACAALGESDGVAEDARAALRLDPLCLAAMKQLVVACLSVGKIRQAGYWVRRLSLHRPQDRHLKSLRRQVRRAAALAWLRRMLG